MPLTLPSRTLRNVNISNNIGTDESQRQWCREAEATKTDDAMMEKCTAYFTLEKMSSSKPPPQKKDKKKPYILSKTAYAMSQIYQTPILHQTIYLIVIIHCRHISRDYHPS